MMPMTIQNFFDCIIKNKRYISFLVAIAIVLCALAINLAHSTTAKVIIKFVGEDAENGLTENGMNIDPYEMSSALVIKNAAMNLGYEEINIEPIRRNMTITPITSTAEKEKYASWIENFSHYEKTEEEKKSPIYYAVSLKTTENTDYARNMLYSIVHQYREYYTKKYTYHYDITALDPDVTIQHDYYDAIEVLIDKIDSHISYLNNIISSDFDYRSYKTGYSLKDLTDKYKLLKESDLAVLEQMVLENQLSKNYSQLINNLRYKLVKTEQLMNLNEQYAVTAKELMDVYSKKNREYLWDRFSNEENQGDQVREEITRDDEYAQYQTTYDQLMTDYVEYRTDYENANIDKNRYEKVISAFEEGMHKNIENYEIEKSLSNLCDRFNSISSLSKEVIGEYNNYRESQSVVAVSGVIVESSANSFFYFTICIILALAVGILTSVAKEMYFILIRKTENNTEKEA